MCEQDILVDSHKDYESDQSLFDGVKVNPWDGTHTWHRYRNQKHETREAIGLGENLLLSFC